MAFVREAHMPGNYELYDPQANRLGPVLCKYCWERSERRNPSKLNTVWVSLGGRRMVWWLCGDCMESLRRESVPGLELLKSSPGVLLSPGL